MTTTPLSLTALNRGALNSNGNEATQQAGSDSDDFLQLMITQLRAQTPLEPVDNESMLQQMSNFSSMEQQQTLNRNLTTLLEFQSIIARMDGLSQGSALIGKTVDYVNPQNRVVSGTVSSVRIDEIGQAIVKVGGQDVPMSSIVGVREGADSDKSQSNDKSNSDDSAKTKNDKASSKDQTNG